MQLRQSLRHSMQSMSSFKKYANYCDEDDDEFTVTMSESFTSFNSSLSSLEAAPEQEELSSANAPRKSSLRRSNSRRRISANPKSVFFQTSYNISYEDDRDFDLTDNERAAMWWTAGELEDMREEINILAGSLYFRRDEHDSYHALVEHAHLVCHTPVLDANQWADTFGKDYRSHYRCIGMERSVQQVRFGIAERRKKLRQIIRLHQRATIQNGMVRRIMPMRAERLRMRCQAISHPSCVFAHSLALAQCQTEQP